MARGHHSAMPWQEVPAFAARLRDLDALAARALERCILTATRSGEVLGASWGEFDLNSGVWTIPGERMKAGKEHVVPLTNPALELLQRLETIQLSEWVFPGQSPRKPLSNMAMTMVMRRLGADHYTVHGFRSTFRDWAGDETKFRNYPSHQPIRLIIVSIA